MATLEDVISSKDPEAIKKKRSTIQRLTTGVRKSLDELLGYLPILRQAADELGRIIDDPDDDQP